jgi:hypothetical protein
MLGVKGEIKTANKQKCGTSYLLILKEMRNRFA